MTSIEMTPIERASRAVIDAAQEQGAYVGGEPDNLRSVPIDGVIDAVALVRAVLAAVREPGEGIEGWEDVPGVNVEYGFCQDGPEKAWSAMIDAMLEEGDEKPAGT